MDRGPHRTIHIVHASWAMRFVLTVALAAGPVATVRAAPAPLAPPMQATPPATPLPLPPPPSYPPDATGLHAPLETVRGVARPRDPLAVRETGDWTAVIAAGREAHALLVWSRGRLVFERYGNGAAATDRPEPASMAKTVMALAMGRAVAEGKLRLDAPLSTYLLEWREDPRGQITLRQALQMTSGLAPLSFTGGAQSPYARFQAGPEMIALALAQQLGHPPGTRFHYQNSVSQLACLALERATGERYADFLSRALWRPIGAADARVWLDTPGGTPRCYSSIYARPRDWLRIGRVIKDRGRFEGRAIIPADWVDAMLTPSAVNANYGLQTWLATPHQPERFYNADRAGYSVRSVAPPLWGDLVFLDGYAGQRVYISRAADTVIVRLGPATLDWDDSDLPNAVAIRLASGQ